jgi:hypothetical protein
LLWLKGQPVYCHLGVLSMRNASVPCYEFPECLLMCNLRGSEVEWTTLLLLRTFHNNTIWIVFCDRHNFWAEQCDNS